MKSRSGRKLWSAVCLVSVLGVGCSSRLAPGAGSSGLRFAPPTSAGPSVEQRESLTLGSWEAVDRLPAGTGIVVRQMDGGDLRGDFRSATSEEIRLRSDDGTETTISKSDVREIRAERDDGNWNGVLIGAGAGVAGSLFLIEAVQSGTSDDLLGTGWAAVPFVLGAVGGLLGWWVDEEHKGTDVIYRAP